MFLSIFLIPYLEVNNGSLLDLGIITFGLFCYLLVVLFKLNCFRRGRDIRKDAIHDINRFFSNYFLSRHVTAMRLSIGLYMAQVYEGKPCGLDRLFQPIERLIYRCVGLKPQYEMSWKRYLSSMLYFNLLGLLVVYVIQRFQFYLPLNPQHFVLFPVISRLTLQLVLRLIQIGKLMVVNSL